MTKNAGQLGHNHPDILGPFGHGCASQFFHGQGIAEVVLHRVEVVQPVGVGHVHQPAVALADLLVVAVQVAHHRLQVHDGLAFQVGDHAEYAVGTGVVRAQVEHDPVGVKIHALFYIARVNDPFQIIFKLVRLPVVNIPFQRINDISFKGILGFGSNVVTIGPAAGKGFNRFFVIGFFVVLAHRMTVKVIPQ